MARKNMELRVAYIFTDCHALMVYRKDVPESPTGYIEVVEVIEKFCERAPKGRIVVHDVGFMAAFKDAIIRAEEPALINGSDNTRNMGLSVGFVSWNNAYGYGCVSSIPSVISNGLSYQPDSQYHEKFEDRVEGNLWCDKKITKIHRLKKKE